MTFDEQEEWPKNTQSSYTQYNKSSFNINNNQYNSLLTIDLHKRLSFNSSKLYKYSQRIINNDKINILMLKKIYSYCIPKEFILIIGYIPSEIIKQFLNDNKILNNKDLYNIISYIKIGYNESFIRSLIKRKKDYLTKDITNNNIINDSNYLISVFKNGKVISKFKYRDLTINEKTHLSYPFYKNTKNITFGETSIIDNINWFKRNFKAFSGGCLNNIKLYTGFYAGGCINACLQKLPLELEILHKHVDSLEYKYYNSLYKTSSNNIQEEYFNKLQYLLKQLHIHYNNTNPLSDIDIFFTGKNYTEAFTSIKYVCEQIITNLKRLNRTYKIVRTNNAITICTGTPIRNIQLIILITQSIYEQLLFFDLDCAAVAYDGNNVLTCERNIRAFNTMWNFIPPSDIGVRIPYSRIVKYYKRGFSVLLYENCKHNPRCDVVPTLETKKKLLKLHSSINNTNIYDSYLLYNKNWSLNDIMNYLKKNESKYSYPPWIIGDFFIDIILPQDVDIISKNIKSHNTYPLPYHQTIQNLKSIRWKQTSEILKHKSLMPRCHMCKGTIISNIKQSNTLGKFVLICDKCNSINTLYINQQTDLTNKIALVTGGRIKIGYAIVLKLLRNGALVITTTRFPYDACNRFQNEPDYEQWKDRIHIYGIDFRNLPSVQEFISHICQSYNKLDILINNAAQTIHRPPAYYKDLASNEVTVNSFIENNPSSKSFFKPIKHLNANPYLLDDISKNNIINSNSPIIQSHCGTILPSTIPPISSPLFSSQYTLIPVIPSDNLSIEDSNKYFPSDKFDEHSEPADLRPKNTWNSEIHEIHPMEMIEVHLVNSAVPTILISQFTKLLQKGAESSTGSFIINVTSPEGQFSASKYKGYHVHTNIAKAGLNMLTRTIAEEMYKNNIRVSSVDTGWITKMTPGGIQNSQTYNAPLTIEDGAARVLHPIYTICNNPQKDLPVGVLYKDFKVVQW